MDEANAPKPDETPGDQAELLRVAAETMRRAEAEWRRAQEGYEKLKREAVARVKSAREATFGQMIDGILAAVRKYPGPGVLVALVAGYFCGRLFRK